MALYSASAEDRDTADYFIVCLEIGAPPNKTKYPVWDCLENWHPNQSASQKTVSSRPPSFGSRIPCPGVAFK